MQKKRRRGQKLNVLLVEGRANSQEALSRLVMFYRNTCQLGHAKI